MNGPETGSAGSSPSRPLIKTTEDFFSKNNPGKTAEHANPIDPLNDAENELLNALNNKPKKPNPISIKGAVGGLGHGVKEGAKAAGGHLRKAGGGLSYVATHPSLWPKIAAKGAKNWGENVLHPAVIAKNLAFDRSKITKNELYYGLGLTEGAIETFIINNTLPPGVARLTRAGLYFAGSQLPLAYYGIKDIRERGKIYKDAPDKVAAEARIKEMEEKHAKAKERVRNFWKGRAAAGTYVSILTATGLMEKGVEVVAKSTGVDLGQATQSAFGKLRNMAGSGQVDQGVSMITNPDQVISSPGFVEASNEVYANPEFREHLAFFDNEVYNTALVQSGLAKGGLSLEDNEQIINAISAKTDDWAKNKFTEGVKVFLLNHPHANIDETAKAGQQYVYDALEKLHDSPDDYQQMVKENQEVIAKILEDRKGPQVVNSGSATVATENPDLDKFITANPEFGVAKAAAVGEKLPLIDQKFDEAVQYWRIDREEMTPEVLAEVKRRFHETLQHTLESKANEYFDTGAKGVLEGNININQAIAQSRERFLVDLSNQDSDLSKVVTEKALISFKDSTFAVEKAAMVGAHMDQVDQATEHAISELGLTGRLSPETTQAIHGELQRKAEELANTSLDQAKTERSGIGLISEFTNTAKEYFETDLQTVLDQESVGAVVKPFAKAEYLAAVENSSDEIKSVVEKVIDEAAKKGDASQVVISPETYQDIYDFTLFEVQARAKRAVYGKIILEYQESSATDSSASDLKNAITQAALEGRKKLEEELASSTGSNSLKAQAEAALTYHLNEDKLLKGKIATAISEVPQGHLSSVAVAPGQTVSHILDQSGQGLEYGPQDSKKLASFIAINYDELTKMHYQLEKAGTIPQDGFFPVTLDDLYDVMKQAENGDPEARKKLMEALRWIQSGHTMKVLNPADQEKIIELLRKAK